MLKVRVVEGVFTVPRILFTLRGNKKSEEVIHRLQELRPIQGLEQGEQECCIFETSEEIQERFQSGISPLSAVVLFDLSLGRGHFRPGTQSRPEDQRVIPEWAHGAHWAVKVGPNCDAVRCARQLKADFFRKFKNQLDRGNFPWGLPRKGEHPPRHIELPPGVEEIIARLNQGPNLAASIADTEHVLELPKGSRISWVRVVPEPVRYDRVRLAEILDAFRCFEQACSLLVRAETDGIRAQLLAGVHLEAGSRLADLYLLPRNDCFSVRRPDLHHTGEGVFASENDEMPGGFPELVYLDTVYNLNQGQWERCFRWMTEQGSLLFVVSAEWSRCYIPEMKWLVEYLQLKGYSAELLTTERMDELSIGMDGVYYRKVRIGTIWRQFPIFETTGKLADLVFAAHDGKVRMIPEFAHFGNKVWFSIFRSHIRFFKEALPARAYEILEEILPDSHLIVSEESFPCTAAGERIGSIDALRDLPAEIRNRLVLKVCGANTLTARSYGVLMGHGLTQETWRQWVDERMRLRQPFIIQRRLETAVASIPVFHTKRQCAELFGCRVLLRPWTFNGELVSVHGCAVPSNTLRVHGRVDMAVLPVLLE